MDPANWIFLQVLIFPSLSLTRFISLWIFTLCCLLFIWNLFIVWFTFIVSTTNKQTNEQQQQQKSLLNCDINFLWYQIPFFSSFRLNNTCRKIKRKLPFSLRCNLNFFLNFNTFYVIYVFYLYISLAFCYIYIFNFMFFFGMFCWLFIWGKQKYKKNVVIFIMPFENICIMPSFFCFCFCFFYSILEMLQQFYIFFALFLPFIIEIWLNYLWYKIIRM